MLALSGVTIVVAIFTLLPTQESLDGEIAAAADFFFLLFFFSFFPWFNFENCLPFEDLCFLLPAFAFWPMYSRELQTGWNGN